MVGEGCDVSGVVVDVFLYICCGFGEFGDRGVEVLVAGRWWSSISVRPWFSYSQYHYVAGGVCVMYH